MTDSSHRSHFFYYSLGFMLLGISLRLILYSINRPLWIDEIFLSLNIIQSPMDTLLYSPLKLNQGAPLGYLFLTKLIVTNFGSSEYFLRLLPLTFGTLSVIAFYKLSQKVVSEKAVPIAVGLFSLSFFLIYYTSEAKQYSLDVFLAIILLYIGINLKSELLNLIKLFAAILVGSISIWLSHPSVFILSAIGLSITIYDFKRNAWNHLFLCSIIFLCWVISFYLCYRISLGQLSENSYFVAYWKDYFFSWPIFSLKNIEVFSANFLFAFHDPRWTSFKGLRALYLFPMVIGGFYLYSKDTFNFYLLSLIVLFAIVAATLQKYPFAIRLVLFLAPISIILVAQGFERMGSYIWSKNSVIGTFFFY